MNGYKSGMMYPIFAALPKSDRTVLTVTVTLDAQNGLVLLIVSWTYFGGNSILNPKRRMK